MVARAHEAMEKVLLWEEEGESGIYSEKFPITLYIRGMESCGFHQVAPNESVINHGHHFPPPSPIFSVPILLDNYWTQRLTSFPSHYSSSLFATQFYLVPFLSSVYFLYIYFLFARVIFMPKGGKIKIKKVPGRGDFYIYTKRDRCGFNIGPPPHIYPHTYPFHMQGICPDGK